MPLWQYIQKNKIFCIIEQSFTPFSVFAPIPIFSFMLFFISTKFTEISPDKLYLLFIGVLTSLLSSGASCFWNHTNDIEEDAKNEKKTLISEKIISHNEAIIISFILYLISILIVISVSYLFNRPIHIYFLIWAIITWWYSDNIFLKKITGIRLKTHYLGELLTYGLAYPAYTMSIWLIFSDSFIKGLILSLIFLFFGIAVVFLKDLKDIKGDREAGLKTLGVIFLPSTLIKNACLVLILYFSVIIIAIEQGFFDFNSFIVVIPFLYLIKNTYLPFHKKNWTLGIGDNKKIKDMVYSTYSSLLILGVVNFI